MKKQSSAAVVVFPFLYIWDLDQELVPQPDIYWNFYQELVSLIGVD